MILDVYEPIDSGCALPVLIRLVTLQCIIASCIGLGDLIVPCGCSGWYNWGLYGQYQGGFSPFALNIDIIAKGGSLFCSHRNCSTTHQWNLTADWLPRDGYSSSRVPDGKRPRLVSGRQP